MRTKWPGDSKALPRALVSLLQQASALSANIQSAPADRIPAHRTLPEDYQSVVIPNARYTGGLWGMKAM